MPWPELSRLEATPSGLYEVSWRAAQSERRMDVARLDTPFIDCGTPAQYLAANLAATAGKSAIGEGAEVDGKVEQCVVWPGAEVRQPGNVFRAITANASSEERSGGKEGGIS